MSSGRVTARKEPLHKSAPVHQPPRSENADRSPALRPPRTSLSLSPPREALCLLHNVPTCGCLPKPARICPFGCVSLFFCVWLPSLNIVLSHLRDAAGGCAASGVQCCTAFRSDKVFSLRTVGSRSPWPHVATEHLTRGRWDSHHPLSVATRLRPLGTSFSDSHGACPAAPGCLHRAHVCGLTCGGCFLSP